MKRFTKKRNKGYIMPFQTQTQIDIEGENFILNYEGREKFHYKGKAIDKLAEYENFMEKNGFKNLQDLQTTVMDSREINKIQKENIKLKVKLEAINSKYILFKPSRGNNKKNIILYVFELVNSLDILNKALYLACEKEYGTNTGNPFLKYKWEIKDYVNDYIKKAEAELEKKKDDKKYC